MNDKTVVNDASVLRIVQQVDGVEVDITPRPEPDKPVDKKRKEKTDDKNPA